MGLYFTHIHEEIITMPTKSRTRAKTTPALAQTWREQITSALPRMSPSNRKIAGFLLEQTNAAAFMSGVQLAQHLDLDPATIVRFAQLLGYRGYPELRAEISASVHENFDVVHAAPARAADTPSAQWQGGLRAGAAAVQNIAGIIVWKDARQFLSILRGAQSVVVVAEGPDVVLAQWLASVLREAGLRALAADASPALSGALVATLHGGDVVIGVAVSVGGEAVAEALSAGATHGARTLALATSASSSAGRASEVVLVCPAPEGGSATVSFAAIAEALRRALGAGKK
jgi:DNA-binding MurR/RpiR family transcriptional regulator